MGNCMTCFGAEPVDHVAMGLGHVKGGRPGGAQTSLELKEQPASPTSPQSPMIAAGQHELFPVTSAPAQQREAHETAESVPDFDFDRFGTCDGGRRSSGNGAFTWDPNDPAADYGDGLVVDYGDVPPGLVLQGVMAAHGVPTIDVRLLLPAPAAYSAEDVKHTAAAIADITRQADVLAEPPFTVFELYTAMAMRVVKSMGRLAKPLVAFYAVVPTVVLELWAFMIAHSVPTIDARFMLPAPAAVVAVANTAGPLVAFGSLIDTESLLASQASLAHMLCAMAVVVVADAFGALKAFITSRNLRVIDARFLLADSTVPARLPAFISTLRLVHVSCFAVATGSATERLLAFMNSAGVATVDAGFLLTDSPALTPPAVVPCTVAGLLRALRLASLMHICYVAFKASSATEQLLAFMGASGVATIDVRFLLEPMAA